VNLAKPQRVKEGSTRPVWAEDTWLQQHAGETLDKEAGKEEEKGSEEAVESEDKVIHCHALYTRVL
jgi:peptidyl-prolyl isomerase E (cyclophilin E)